MSDSTSNIKNYGKPAVAGLLAGCIIGVFVAGGAWLILADLSFAMVALWVLIICLERILGRDRYVRLIRRVRGGDIGAFLGGTYLAAAVVGVVGDGVNNLLYALPGKYLNWMAIAVLPIGYAAHVFKGRNQELYGTIEVLVGFATALGSTSRTDFHAPQGLAILGAVYVVARGFNNVSEARRKNNSGVTALPSPSAVR
jgi:hypothetical protein